MTTLRFEDGTLTNHRPTRRAILRRRYESGDFRVAPRSGNGWDLVCFSHLRWDFVFQRPQHLLTRFARQRRVFFIEEPTFEGSGHPQIRCSRREAGLHVVTPQLAAGTPPDAVPALLEYLINGFLERERVADFALWYYTPMALPYTRRLDARAVIYDCMDELSAFQGAPPELMELERDLLRRANLVFTGGQSLFEAKRNLHPNVHAFPSSIDRAHFGLARSMVGSMVDQVNIPRPRLGFFGVIDERMDLELIGYIARSRPDWHLVLIGPVAKIAPESLPKGPNIHYLGMKTYMELPAYIAGWDVALLPFALNASTRFISPTKTPEYLAAGRPVISTAVTDVVRPWGERGLVHIAADHDGFVAGIAEVLKENHDRRPWRARVDKFLSDMSWDGTWDRMNSLAESAIRAAEDVQRRRRMHLGNGYLGERRRIEAIDGHATLGPRFRDRRRMALPVRP